ncbi:MAG: AMP-binding protein [Thermoanaerobaculia bacterium]|nr:AMP-binding protein [Thermoanaerobaculia bacterium]
MFAEPFETLADLVFLLREQWGGRRDLLQARSGGRLATLSSRELIADVHAFALSLEGLGAEPGDRVALFSGNRPGWLVADLAAHLLGLVTVPIDPRLPVEEVGFILRNSGAGWLIYGGPTERELLDRLLSGLQPAPRLISMDDEGLHPQGLALTRLVGQGAEQLLHRPLDSLRGRTTPRQLASLAYTSGATGDPRGVRISQGALAASTLTLVRRLALESSARAVSLLPFAHPLERVATYSYLIAGVTVLAPSRGTDPLLVVQRESPDVFVAPPGLLEGAHLEVLKEIERSSALRRAVFRRSLAAATPSESGKRRPGALVGSLGLGLARRSLGGRARTVVSAFHPVAVETERFFRAARIDLCIGYGLVEACGLITATRRMHRTVGTAGRPLAGWKLRTDRDGEISVAGPSLMEGYWQSEGAPAIKEDAEGVRWFATGDVGRIDRAGRLHLRARRSSRLVLTSGEVIAPHPIEQRLQSSPAILRAIVVGQGQPVLGALIVPSPDATAGTTGPAGMTGMASATSMEERVAAELQRLNHDRPEAEKVRRFHLLPRPLDVDHGELTPNGQLRRKAIAKIWRHEIAALFSLEATKPKNR